MKTILPFALGGLCLALSSIAAQAQRRSPAMPETRVAVMQDANDTWWRADKQAAQGQQAHSHFGQSVATDGDWLAVGSPSYDDVDPERIADGGDTQAVGKVDLYQRAGDGWTLRQSIVGPQSYAQFGYSVAVRGDDLVVGAPAHDLQDLPNVGRVSFYRRQGSAWLAIGTFACCSAGAEMGVSVALGGTRPETFAYIGAPHSSSSMAGAQTGLVFAFCKVDAGWALEDLPTPADLVQGDRYGAAIGGSGNVLIVGAPFHATDGVTSAGAAYVFRRSTAGVWSQQQKLGFFDPAMGDVFGGSVAIDNDWIAIGAVLRTVAGHAAGNTGAVQMFRYTAQYGWSGWQELTGVNAAAGDNVGSAIALDGANLVIGARNDDSAVAQDAGSVYFFHRATSGNPPVADWQQSSRFFHANAATDDVFGTSVALAGQIAVAGSYGDDSDALPALVDSGSFTTFLTDGIFADGIEL